MSFYWLTSRKGDVWLLSAKWATPVVGLVGGVIAARHLDPEEFGIFQAVALIPIYVGFLQLGVFNGLNRNLPLSLAKDDPGLANRFVNASSKMAKWVAVTGILLGLFVVVALFLRAENKQYPLTALALIPALAFAPLRTHIDVVYRGTRSFGRLGSSLHIQNLSNLLWSLSTSFLGLAGMALRLATMNLVGWLLLIKNPPIRSSGSGSWKDVRTLSVVGVPMLINGVIYQWLFAADRSVVAVSLGAEQLGYFALAGMVTSAIQVLPTSINMLLYPRVAHAFGRSGSSRGLRRYIWIGLGINLCLMIPTVALVWLLLPYFVENFLPAYESGIGAARITLIGCLFFAYSGPSVIIPIVRRNLPMQVMGLITLGLVWLLGFYAAQNGYGIEGVATVKAVAIALYGTFVIGFSFYLTNREIGHEFGPPEGS